MIFCVNKDNNSGFSYIETILGISILAAVALSLFALFDLTLRVLWENKARLGAQSIAIEKMETVKNMPYDDVGTQGGIPSGTLPQNETVIRNGISYTVNTAIIYIDDPYDGTLGGNPEDLLPTDYKQVRISVSWNSRLGSKPVVYVTNIVPKGMESTTGGGTLRIKATNASGAVLGQADVQIENSSVSPAVNVSLKTNNNGMVILPGAPASVEGYKVVVSKSGYSTDQTYDPVIPDMPTSARPRLTVAEGSVTDATFVIDLLSSMDVYSLTIREYTPSWWDTNYGIRRRLTVVNNNTSKSIPAGYSVKFNFNHYQEVSQGDSLASGDDVRLLWYDGANWQEIHRVAETAWNDPNNPTQIWFKLQDSIPAGGSDNNYFLYYKNTSPPSPLADRRQVYAFWDDFSDPDYTYSTWATSTNTWSVSGGKYVQSSSAGESQAWAGSAMSDYLVRAKITPISGVVNVGLIGRRQDGGNFAVGRGADFPKQIAQSDSAFNVFGYRSFVQSTDGTLGIFTASTTGAFYRLYISADNGYTWNKVWEMNAGNSNGLLGHSAWLDPSSNEILFVYTRYISTTDDYQIRLIRFSYNSSQRIWTAGAPEIIAAYNYTTRPYNPSVIRLGNVIAVTYARYQADNKNEIAAKISMDNGANWSTESWISSFNTAFSSDQELNSLRGDLIIYNNQITAVLNGARNISWRSFNGVNWLSAVQITSSTYQNEAFSVITTGSGSSQNVHIFYRHNGDSGRLHRVWYDGSSWYDEVVVNDDVNYNISSSAVAALSGTDIFVFYTPQNTDDLYLRRYTSGNWLPAVKVYEDVSDVKFITSLRSHNLPGSLHLLYTVNSSPAYFYYHNIGMYGTSALSPAVLTLRIAGVDTNFTPALSDLSLNKEILLTAILDSTSVHIYTDKSLIFEDILPVTVNSGQFGLYTNSTSASFDDVLARMYITPEPTVSGDLEEVYEESQPLPNLSFRMYGSKVKGYASDGSPVYKYDQNLTTDSTGKVSIPSLEWDSYNFFVATSTGYDISAIDPPDPVNLLPDTNKQVNIYVVGDQLHTLRVIVVDPDGNPIQDADVRLYSSSLSYDKTITTPSHGQAFFSPLTQGTYDITVTKTGYDTYSNTLEVSYIETLRVILYQQGNTPPPSPPQAPTITGFTNVTESSMTINWTDNANNEDGYKVYYNTINSKPATPAATLSANSTSYQVLGLNCGTTYYFWVEAYNTQGSADDTASQDTSGCSPSVFFFDTFTEESDTTLASHIPDTGDGWILLISIDNGSPSSNKTLEADDNDRLDRDTCGRSDGALYRIKNQITSSNYEVSVTQLNGDTGDDYNILAARIQDANNMYAAKWNERRSYLYKRVNGIWTQLASLSSGISDGSTVTLKVQGTSISLLDDGVTKLSVSDNSISSGGYAGVGMGAVITNGDDCSSQRLDNFQVLITN